MKASHDEPTKELPIVSRSLLRIANDEWATPEELFECLTGNALSQLLVAAETGSPGAQAIKKRALLLFDCLLRVLGEPAVSSPIAFGRFSESALAAATLLDNTGKRINAVETDAGLTLTVLKERDAGDGWHDVLLKGEVADVVRRWLEVTAPLRSHMKRHGLNGWQNLVIYTGNPLGAPAYFHRSSNINSFFRHFALTDNAKLGNLAKSVTIPKIRSTRGVMVFLDTMDITQMAKELGNSSETSLKHYLPDSLWDYFTTRWLRIFQNLLIVEASPFNCGPRGPMCLVDR